MKEITYKERADFYFEETYSSVDHEFIEKIIQLYSINSVLDIPCGAGRNLQLLARCCKLAVFADMEQKMLDQIMKRIEKLNYTNCKCIQADINKFRIDNKVDMTIVMRQALQLFPPQMIYNILENLILSTSKILILDLYDFKSNMLNGQVPEYLREKRKMFNFSRKTIIRFLDIKRKDEGILVNYVYKMGTNVWKTQFELFYLSPEYIKQQIMSIKNVKKIIEYHGYSFEVKDDKYNSIVVVEI